LISIRARQVIGPALFRASRGYMQARAGSVTNVMAGGGLGRNKPKTSPIGLQIVLFREAALVAAQYARH
jgi:hypothetical protein